MTSKQQAIAEAEALGLTVDADNETEAQIRDRIAEHVADAGDASTGAGDEPRSDGNDGVASTAANADLEHSTDPGGRTTRDDLTDVGVPVLPGSPAEPVGPEDALGVGEKRGDYRDRVPGNPHESRPIAGGGAPVTRWVDRETGAEAEAGAKGAVEVTVDYAPTSEVVAQKPRTETIGDAAGLKGGVETDPLSPIGRAISDVADRAGVDR